jgi:aspartyl-tRNA synthetase
LLQYRYLDLRRPKLQRNLMMRALEDQPGDAQLLPRRTASSRWRRRPREVHARRRAQLPRARRACYPGKFYALAESPQLFKQMLHGGGLRALLPDRALLPRRGPAHRPSAGVHADRRRDVLHQRRTTSSRWSRAWSSGLWKELLGIDLAERYPSGAFPRLNVRGEHAALRQRQAGHALRHGAPRPHRAGGRAVKGGGISAARADRREVRERATYRKDLPRRSCKALVVPCRRRPKKLLAQGPRRASRST